MKPRRIRPFIAVFGAALFLMPNVSAGHEGSGTQEIRIEEEQTAAAVEPAVSAEPAAAPPSSPDGQAGWESVAENANLVLYLNRETTEISVKDKRSGMIWHTNPEDRLNDAIASPAVKDGLGAQFSLTYYNSKNQAVIYDNFKGSIRNKQFDIQVEDGRVRIVYSLGDAFKGIDATPKRVGKLRFETEILGKIEDPADREYVRKKYKFVEESGIYERYDKEFSPLVLKKVTAILAGIGYDEEQLRIDNESNPAGDAVSEEKLAFRVTLVYSLDEDSLLVEIPVKEIQQPKSYPIHSISLLEYFGAAGPGAEGYLLVPDGSGALIRFGDGKQAYPAYSQQIYGDDGTRNAAESVQVSETARLPVFGMNRGQAGFLAVIEGGDAIAGVEADVGGRAHSYHHVNASFTLKARDTLKLQGAYSASEVSIFQPEMPAGDIRVRYAFLSGTADSGYAGMARFYRNYLAAKHDMRRLPAGDIPFYLELVGDIPQRKTFLGIPYQSMLPLTTFSQAEEIAGELLQAEVRNIKLRYTGWFNGGYYHTLADRVSPDKKLGGSQAFAKLTQFAEENGVELFPDVAFLKVYRDSGSFRPNRDASRLLNRRPAKLYSYNPATFVQDKSAPPYWILSAGKLPGIVGRFSEDYGEYGIGGLSLRDLANEVHSDFRRNAVIDRQEAADTIRTELGKLEERFPRLLVEGGNALALPYADHVLRMPTGSSRFYIEDESVPFLQMVLHGYADYAGMPFNAAADQSAKANLLKVVEMGANVYYQWFYERNEATIPARITEFYAMNYRDWIGDAAAQYSEINRVLGPVRNQAMTGHEKLADNVYKTVYENGFFTIVNYNRRDVQADGLTVPAESFVTGGAGS